MNDSSSFPPDPAVYPNVTHTVGYQLSVWWTFDPNVLEEYSVLIDVNVQLCYVQVNYFLGNWELIHCANLKYSTSINIYP